VKISSAFDSGNIEIEDSSDPSDVKLAIKKDSNSDFMQWFHFRASGVRGVDCRFRIRNASQASYANAWRGYRVCASYDLEHWFRVDTTYDESELVITHTPEVDSVYYAYFAPYGLDRHRRLVAGCGLEDRVEHELLGQTLDGRDLDLLIVGEAEEGRQVVWVVARQHPGESMAEWWMEGFLARLLDANDALARRLLREAVFYIVPNMNPDGSFRGHLRTNAAGANLNREWHAPTMDRSPEVLLARDRMDQTGVSLCLDVHGDEELPYNFISGAEGIKGWTEVMAKSQDQFCRSYMRSNPDFQMTHGYGIDKPGEANMTMCSNQISQRFDCLAMTLEMPFKDTIDTPDLVHGWSPERSKRLGASVIDALADTLPLLR
jgi:murein tripeptide amidase MpaA